MSTALERELRLIKERVDVLWGSRGAVGQPDRAVRLRELGQLGGGGSGQAITRLSQLQNDTGYVNATAAAAAAPVQEVQAGSNITISYPDGAKYPRISATGGGGGGGGTAFYYGAGLPTGGTYENGDRAFDTDTGREYTYIEGSWLDLTSAAFTWVPILSWRHSADGDAAEIDSPDLSPYSEVMVIGEAVTTSVSAWRVIRFSDDGGSSYDATNNYININTSGSTANTDNALYLHGAANAAARRVFATIPAINTSLPKVIDCPRGPTFYTKATPINRMRIYPTSGVFTGGEIHILAR